MTKGVARRSPSKRGATKRKRKFPYGASFEADRPGTCCACRKPWEKGDLICAQPKPSGGDGYGHIVCSGQSAEPYWATAPT